MRRYEFDLHISPAEYLDYYRGVATQVIARSGCGETVRFPAFLFPVDGSDEKQGCDEVITFPFCVLGI